MKGLYGGPIVFFRRLGLRERAGTGRTRLARSGAPMGSAGVAQTGYRAWQGNQRVVVTGARNRVLATLAPRWRLMLEPNQEVTPIQLVTVRPKNGLRMRVELRTSEVRTPTFSVQPS